MMHMKLLLSGTCGISGTAFIVIRAQNNVQPPDFSVMLKKFCYCEPSVRVVVLDLTDVL